MADPKGFLTVARQTPSRRPVDVRIQDWKEVYEPQDFTVLQKQASRCMDCGIPFCHQGCPLGNLIPEWNDLIWRGEKKEAIARLHATNNFPEFTGRLCPAPCETACVVGVNGDPVTIKQVELRTIEEAFDYGDVNSLAPDRLSGKTVDELLSSGDNSLEKLLNKIQEDHLKAGAIAVKNVYKIEFKKGEKIVLVHGGGPQINEELEIHSIKPEMINGLRKTTPEVFKIVQKVLAGDVLRGITNQLIGLGIDAVGISSGDGGLIRAEQKMAELGLVGEISKVDFAFIDLLIANGKLPVISPNGVNIHGKGLNLNADLVAGALGGAARAQKVLFMTDVVGILENYPDPTSLIKEISFADLSAMKEKFVGGMLPKVEAALVAINAGAQSVVIFDGRKAENLRIALHGEIGTLVVP